MFVVGIAKLAGRLQDEAQPLAADLGITAYEARMLLAPGVPVLVLMSHSRTEASSLVSNLRERGHEALAFDSNAVTFSRDMIRPKSFTLTEEGMTTNCPNPMLLRFAEIMVMLHATHETHVGSTREAKAVYDHSLAGPEPCRTSVSITGTTRSSTRHEVLYIYVRGGERPWFLHEVGTRYLGLGARMAATPRANFMTTVQLLRTHAAQAVYDQSLVGRTVPERLWRVEARGSGPTQSRLQTTSDQAMDLLCHFVAMRHVMRQSR